MIDTHAYFKHLTAAGMPEAQAEVIAHERALRFDDLVTKKDVELMEQRLTIKYGAMLIGGLAATTGTILALLPMMLK
ncbi:MAG: CCDC90 family protein [Alphaproteobacteria bacterium]|nr:CCDC90 family protein [Alphaproteobacteria bacterium]